MKKHLRIAMAVMFLFAVLGMGVQAEGASSQGIVATIPFSFNVGNTAMPAGKYTITVINPSSDRRALQIRSVNGRSTVMIQTNSVLRKASDNAKLVFHQYGDRYFFAEAQLAGDPTTLAAIKSRAEKTQQRETVAKAGTVVIIGG